MTQFALNYLFEYLFEPLLGAGKRLLVPVEPKSDAPNSLLFLRITVVSRTKYPQYFTSSKWFEVVAQNG